MLKIKPALRVLSLFLLTIITTANGYDYDLIIIGAGAAGLTVAQSLKQSNKKIAIIEKSKLGGSRIWKGDIPTKTFIEIANNAYLAKNLTAFGVHYRTDQILFDYEKIFSHVRSIIQKVYTINTDGVTHKNSNASVIYGSPRFIDNHTIVVNGRYITTEKFVIATGACVKKPKIQKIDSVPYITSDCLFDQNHLPASITIIGAGPLGTEMATALNRLGIDVTLIMRHGLILPTFDFEIITLKMKLMELEGIRIQTSTTALSVSKETNDELITINCIDHKGKKRQFHSHALFIALGRTPNIDELDLDKAGIAYTKKGIIVDSTMQTTAHNIYACGDVVGGLNLLSRVAYYQAKIVAHNIFRSFWNRPMHADYKAVPKIIYTSYPIACAGLTEQEAHKLYGNNLIIYKCSYEISDRAHIQNATIGLAKFICDQNGILIGVHVFGKDAGYLIDYLTLGKKFTEQQSNLKFTIRISPSYFDVIEKAKIN